MRGHVELCSLNRGMEVDGARLAALQVRPGVCDKQPADTGQTKTSGYSGARPRYGSWSLWGVEGEKNGESGKGAEQGTDRRS